MVQSFATTEQAAYSAEYPFEQIAGVNDIYIGEDGNLAIAGTTPVPLDQINAVLYACANAAKSQLGEMVLQTNRGLPNFQAVWTGVPNIPLWEAVFRQLIESIPGVNYVEEIITQRAYNTEAYTNTQDILIYTVTIITAFGQGVFNGSV